MMKTIITAIIALNLGTLSVFSAQSSTAKPVVLEKVQPSYPQQCQQSGIEGRVIVECLITQQGEVVGATAIKSPNPELAAAAVAAVQQWTFAPATHEGKPTQAVIRIPVEFRLEMDQSGALVPSILARN
ncbi:MAG: energy transducer TonB [Opitutales bacterium]|nr:energy transducer TonB [Opitutales bacterium]